MRDTMNTTRQVISPPSLPRQEKKQGTLPKRTSRVRYVGHGRLTWGHRLDSHVLSRKFPPIFRPLASNRNGSIVDHISEFHDINFLLALSRHLCGTSNSFIMHMVFKFKLTFPPPPPSPPHPPSPRQHSTRTVSSYTFMRPKTVANPPPQYICNGWPPLAPTL